MTQLITKILPERRGRSSQADLRRGLQWLVVLVLIASLFAAPAPAQAAVENAIPTFNILAVATDQSVTIQTFNFPANQIFTVRIGAYGTLGIGGVVVATTNSGAGGSYQETYTIPDSLKGSQKLAIRMDSAQGYFAYNWFVNSTSGTTSPTAAASTAIPSTGYSGIPTFSIASVVTDDTVTVLTNNFPANQNFTVRMGAYGTLGIGGTVVATTNSGAGGAFQATYDIPDALKGSQRIAIRMDSTGGFFAYNWFWNNTGGTSPTAIPGSTAIPSTGYTGIPTFSIASVAADDTVTVLTNNFPANQNFTVRMGAYGTLGIGGTVVATTNSGAGGAFQATYDIPDALKGSQRIAIRMDSTQGFFAYNWFWNNTTGTTPAATATAVATAVPGATAIPSTGYTGIPTFSIASVAKDASVTILTNNFPANQNFTVRMGAYGSKGEGGIVVATTNSGAGGAFQATYTIPDALKGSDRIAIRLDSPAGYFAFNWFWNNTAP